VVGAAPNGREVEQPSALVDRVGRRTRSPVGVDGETTLEMRHRAVFDTRKLMPLAQQIRAIQLIFSGGDSWELRAYDASTVSEKKKTSPQTRAEKMTNVVSRIFCLWSAVCGLWSMAVHAYEADSRNAGGAPVFYQAPGVRRRPIM